MNADDAKDAGSVAETAWGGLADTLRQNCTDLASIDASTAGLLQRLDQLAACTTLDAIASALRVFTKAERDYLMSPLLDEIYSGMTCEPIPVPPGKHTRARPPKGNALACPVQTIANVNTGHALEDASPVVISPTCAIPIACMNGYDLALAFFFDRGGVINESYQSRLRAVGHQHFTDLAPLIQIPFALDYDGNCTPLFLSSYYGHAPCVEWLLRNGVDGDPHVNRNLVLLAAAKEGRDEVIEVLLNHWGDFKKVGALRCAAGAGRVSTVKLLIAARLDVNEEGGLPLFMAVQNNHLDVVQMLLDSGVDAALNDFQEFYDAVRAGRAAMVRLLLRIGPNVGRALQYAAQYGHVDVAEILIEAGADHQ